MRIRLSLGLLLLIAAGWVGPEARADEAPSPWADRSLEAWVEDLQAEEPATRRAAALALFLHAPTAPDLEAPLLRRLDDGDARVRLAALQALLHLPKPPRAGLEQAAEDANAAVALLGTEALLARGAEPEHVVPTLARLASHRSRTPERVRALELLAAMGEAAAGAAPALVATLAEADPYTADEIVDVLVAIGPAAVPALFDGEPDDRRRRIAEAIRSLNEGPEPTVWWRMRRLVRGEADAEEDMTALVANPEACRPFLPELKEALLRGRPHDEGIRRQVARVVRHAEPEVDLDFWKEILAGRGSTALEEAAWALAPYADDLPDTWQRLVEILRHTEHLESGAAEALVRIGAPVVPAVHEVLSRASGAVPRLSSALVLVRIRDGVIPLVEPLAENRREPGGHAAWPRLVLLHLDPSRKDVRQSLGWSLRNAGQPPKSWFLDRLQRVRYPYDPLLGGLEGLIADKQSSLALRVEAVRVLGRFAPSSGLAMWILVGARARPEEAIAAAADTVLAEQDLAAWHSLAPAAARVLTPPPAQRRLTRAEVEKLEPRFVSKQRKIRVTAIHEVTRGGELSDDMVRAIAYCLDDREMDVRLTAAQALDGYLGRVVEDRLLDALSDEKLQIRASAARGLRLAGGSTQASLPYLLEAFRDIDPAVERAIQGSIAHRDVRFAHLIGRYRKDGARMAYELLSRIAKHGEDAWPILHLVPRWLPVERARHSAIHVLLGMGDRGRDTLAIAMATADPATAAAIARAYERQDALTEGEAIWLRDRAIQFDRMEASWPCFRAIAKHGVWKKGSVVTLIQKLEREPKRLEAGIGMLGGSGFAEAAPFLTTLLADEEHRRAALYALAGLGPKAAPALGAVRALIPTADRDELHAILSVLAGMGRGAESARDDLLELLGGDERIEPYRVMGTLLKILPQEGRARFLERQLLDLDPERRSAAMHVARTFELDERLRLVLGWIDGTMGLMGVRRR